MKHEICDKSKCTACGVCALICPKKCIEREFGSDDSWHLVKNESDCIHCGLCEKVCPNINTPSLHYPDEAFVAWSNNHDDQRTGASGGIATTLYRFALDNEFLICGALMDNTYEVHFHLTDNCDYLEKFKRSKYTFSYLDRTPVEILEQLHLGKNVLFIGMPCQVASIKNYCGLSSHKGKLLTVDLACHGMPSPEYLKKHIQKKNSHFKKKADMCEFRDPGYGTENYVFSLYESSEKVPFYKREVYSDDLFQVGYHNALIYRENCYRCNYARRERVGDITLSDYNGLGKLQSYDGNRHNVSCVLINTDLGKQLFSNLIDKNYVVAQNRPIEEPLSSDKQYNEPSRVPKERDQFLEEYARNRNYDASAETAFISFINRNKKKKYLNKINKLKTEIISQIPFGLKIKIKRLLRR